MHLFARVRDRSGFWIRLAGRWWKFPCLALVGALAWASLLPATRTSPIFGDEIGWISVSSYSADLVRSGKFDWNFWNTDSFGAWGPMNPPVGKIALGLPLRMGNPETPFRAQWDWSLDEEGNRARGNLPSHELLQKARRIAAIQAALVVVVVCALGWATGGPAVGLIAAGLLLVLPTWRETGPLVLTDLLVSAALLSMIFPAIRLLGRPDADRGLGFLAAMGGLLGLAAAIKPTGLVLGGLFLVAVLLVRILRSRRILPHILGGVLAAAIAGSTMVALDPWLWPDLRTAKPVEVLREVPVAFRVLRGPQPLATLRARRGEFAAIEAISRPAWIVVRAKRWKDLIQVQRALPGLQWEGPRALVLLKWLVSGLVAFPLEPVFVLIGILSVVGLPRSFSWMDRSARRSWFAPLLFGGVALFYTMAFVVLPVGRYLLPLLVCLQLLAAQGILFSLEFLFRQARRRPNADHLPSP